MGIGALPTFLCENERVVDSQWKWGKSMADQSFQLVKGIVDADSRGRLSIGAAAKGKSYRVMVNNDGQILLDPVVAIPERELWLWQNPEVIASVQCGIQQASNGELEDAGSFAQYADLDVGE
jgi:hypothetical protein